MVAPTNKSDDVVADDLGKKIEKKKVKTLSTALEDSKPDNTNFRSPNLHFTSLLRPSTLFQPQHTHEMFAQQRGSRTSGMWQNSLAGGQVDWNAAKDFAPLSAATTKHLTKGP